MNFPHFPGLYKNRTQAEVDLFIATMKAFNLDPANVAACIEFETGGTWSTTSKGPAGSFSDPPGYAAGLIGFAPATAKGLGTTVEQLMAMGFEQQLGFVVRYFQAVGIAKLKRPVDYYAAVFWPAAVGTSDDYIIASKPSKVYEANAGLDRHKNGTITTADLRETIAGVLMRASGVKSPVHETAASNAPPPSATRKGVALLVLVALAGLAAAGFAVYQKMKG